MFPRSTLMATQRMNLTYLTLLDIWLDLNHNHYHCHQHHHHQNGHQVYRQPRLNLRRPPAYHRRCGKHPQINP